MGRKLRSGVEAVRSNWEWVGSLSVRRPSSKRGHDSIFSRMRHHFTCFALYNLITSFPYTIKCPLHMIRIISHSSPHHLGFLPKHKHNTTWAFLLLPPLSKYYPNFCSARFTIKQPIILQTFTCHQSCLISNKTYQNKILQTLFQNV